MADTRFCRICWNSQGWQRPTGEAAKIESSRSYVAVHGFGHEEWLFNLGWTIGDYHYGFLQPFRQLNADNSQVVTVEVILYTIHPDGTRFFVGRIEQCELLTRKEAEEAFRIYRQQGWLNEMAMHLKQLNLKPTVIKNAFSNPFSVSNVRFNLHDREILDPLIPAPRGHQIYRTGHYWPLYASSPSAWKQIQKLRADQTTQFRFKSGRLKSTERRKRAAQKGVSFDPAHDRLQEALLEYLRAEYSFPNVGYEVDGVVDLVVKQEDRFVFYEIKMEGTVKRCIRLALGQLLEYAHWPARNKAHKLIVIGKVLPREDDKRYLSFLRKQYGLSLYYQHYDSATNTLSQEY